MGFAISKTCMEALGGPDSFAEWDGERAYRYSRVSFRYAK